MKNEKLHAETKRLATTLTVVEKNLIAALIVVEERQAYRDFKYKGLFTYCEKHLKMTKHISQLMRMMVNHALALPELRQALEQEKISVAYASRIASRLNEENVAEVLAYCAEHSVRETEKWLTKERGLLCHSKITVDSETLELIQSTKEFVGGNPSTNDLIKKVFKEFHSRNHPVEKAKKAAARRARAQDQRANSKTTDYEPSKSADSVNTPKVDNDTRATSTSNEKQSRSRESFKAGEIHEIHLRDEKRCTFRETTGVRCDQTRWTHKHHIIPISEGGTNDPSNIATLCPEHHDLVHQMCFPFAEQRSWIDHPTMNRH